MINFRTDLALERRDLFKKANNIENEVDGLKTQEETFDNNIKVSRVKVLNENGEQAIGKRKGTYITIDIKNLKIAGEDQIQKASEAVTKELKNLIGNLVGPQEDILVVGLGNLYVTPDALGPKVVNEIVEKDRNETKYVYGLSGLAKLLNCSKNHAGKLKSSGIFDEAIIQNGRKIIIDSEKALELFKNRKKKKK